MKKKLAVLLAGIFALIGSVLASDPTQFAYPISGAPIATVSVSTTSASQALNGASCYRVACSAVVYWRVGVLPLTALTTDNAFYGPAVEMICLRSGYTGIAFVTSTGTGTCTINSLAPAP